ncbi:MAG: extracellular solute-binding protein [Hydrogenoanaerobacterium sp.]
MKKLVLCLAIIMVFSSVLCSCGKTSASSAPANVAPSEENIELTFLNKYPEEEYKPYFDKAIKDFEAAHPNVKIKMESVGDDQIKDKLRIIAGGELPDIFFTWPGEFQRKFDRAGLTLNITPYLNEDTSWKNGFMPAVLQSGVYNEENHSIPFRYSTMFILYNKTIFDKYNLTEPKTYEDFLTTCETLKSNGEIPLLFGNAGTWYGAWYIGTFNQLCVPYETKMQDYDPTSGKFEHPGYLTALQNIVDLQTKGYFSPNVLSVDYYQVREQFCAGKGAMIVDGTSQFSIYEKDCVNDWGFFKVPAITGAAGSNDYITGGAEAYAISAKTKNPKMAVEFVKFLTTKEQAYKQTAETGLPNAIIGAIDDGNGTPKLLEGIKLLNDYKGISAWLDTDVEAKVADAYMTAVSDCLGGKAPSEALKSVQKAAEEVKADLKK